MRKALLIFFIFLKAWFLGGETIQAEPSWFPFPYPCDTKWTEGEKYYCETMYSAADLLSAEDGEELKLQTRRFCRLENGAFTAILKDGERGYLTDDGYYEPYKEYGLSI